MDSELIDHYVDRRGFKSDSDFIIAELNKINAEFVKAKKATENVIGAKTWREFRESTEEAKKAQESFTKTTQNFLKTEKEASAEKLRAAKAAKAEADAIIRAAKAKEAEEKAKQAGLKTQAAEITLREKNTKAAEREAAEAAKKASLSSRPVDSIPFEINTGENITEYKNKLTDIQQKQLDLEHSAIAWAEAEKQKASSLNTSTKEIENQSASLKQVVTDLERNVQERDALKNSIKEMSDWQKEDKKELDAGKISRSEYNQRMTESSIAIEQAKNRVSELNKDIKIQTQTTKDSQNAYKALVRQYEQAAMKAKILAVTYGESNIKTVEAARRAKELNEQLKRIDASTGQNHRNVGNYTSGWAKFGAEINKSLAPLRTFANIMPGLGMSGIIMGIFTVTKELFGFNKAMSQSDILLYNLTERIKNAEEGFKKFKDTLNFDTELAKLRNEIEKGTGFENDIFGLQQDSLKSELSIKKLNETLSASYSELEKHRKEISKWSENTKGLNNIRVVFGNEFSKVPEDLVNSLTDVEKNMFTFEKTLLESIKNTNKQINDEIQLSSLINIRIKAKEVEEKRKKEKDDANKSKAAIEAERRAAMELFKFRTGLLIEEQNRRVDFASSGSDGKGYITERTRLYDLEKELAKGIAAFELKEANLSASGRKLIEEKLKEDLKKIDRQRRNDIINTQDEMFKAIWESSEKGAKDLEEREKTEKERQKQLEITNLTTTFEARQRVIEQAGNAELQQNLELYQEGKISKEAYELAKLGIENKTRRESLKAEIEHYNQLILLSNLTPQEQAKAFEDLQKVRKNLRDLDLKDAEQNANKEIEIERNKNEYLKQLATELYGLVGDIFTAGLERQKNAIQEQIDLLEERKQKEIEVAEQTITNEVEKAAAIAVIEARAQTQREQLERRQRDLEVRRAQIEQISQVGATIGSTAQDVAKLSGQAAIAKAQAAILASNPLTAAFAPAAIAAAGLIASQIPIVIAIGAAQAARILATPVPKYKLGKGKGDNYEGLAVVGDGGKHELHQKPDGTSEITPNTPTLTWVGRDDIIHPDVNAMMKRSVFQTHKHLHGVETLKQKDDGVYFQMLAKSLGAKIDMLNNTIKNKSEAPQAYPDNLMRRVERYKQGNKEYFKRKGYDID